MLRKIRVHVAKHKLKEVSTPALCIVKEDGSEQCAKEIVFSGDVRLVQAYPDEPAPAPDIRAWIETTGYVYADGKKVYP